MKKRITSFALLISILASSLFFIFPVKAETAKDAYMGVNDAFVVLKSVFQGLGAITGIVDMDTLVNDYIKADEYWSSRYDESSNSLDISGDDSPIYYNSVNNSYVFKPQYFNTFINYANDYIHRLDGYYLIESNISNHSEFYLILKNYCGITNSLHDDGNILSLNNFSDNSSHRSCFYSSPETDNGRKSSWVYHFSVPAGYIGENGRSIFPQSNYKIAELLLSTGQLKFNRITSGDSLTITRLWNNNSSLGGFYLGSPLMLFYNKLAYDKYINNGKHYVPARVPSSNVEIPANSLNQTYITESIGDISVNVDGLSDEEIQYAIDAAVQDALDKINISVDYPSPSPTEPPLPDDSPDFTVTNAWLKKIYEYFQTFGKSHDTFAKKITDYIEKNNSKLDQIITALDKIGSGSPSGTENGCKYDYTALSEFLSELWNESDKKFDEMVKLLEENNKYQEQIISSLNDIKALLVVDTVLDFFQNRSNETANKAKEKFPTSIPWDIAMVVNVMCAEPESPVIRCPIKIDSLSINEELVIDLSQEEWSKLAKTCRSMLSILFVLYMIHLTRELFFKGGDA